MKQKELKGVYWTMQDLEKRINRKEYTHVLKELRLEDEQLTMKTFEKIAG